MKGMLRFSGAVKREPAIDTWLTKQAPELGAIAHGDRAQGRGVERPDQSCIRRHPVAATGRMMDDRNRDDKCARVSRALGVRRSLRHEWETSRLD
jgi:hypothetical protein